MPSLHLSHGHPQAQSTLSLAELRAVYLQALWAVFQPQLSTRSPSPTQEGSPTDPFPRQHHMRFPAAGGTTHALASTAGQCPADSIETKLIYLLLIWDLAPGSTHAEKITSAIRL